MGGYQEMGSFPLEGYMATLIGQELGGYRIISQVGKGGMATVYKAFQPSLDRYVALKVMPPFYAQEDETFIKRFKREAQSIAKLRHPNILLVIDFGEHDGLIYIVMEFVDAGTLKDRLGKPMPLDQAVKIFDQVASALDYAHMQGLVHRDVKPSNILLPKPDWPLLTDFGLAKIVGGSHLTITGTIAGTPAYMSPEQGQGESVDARSDIYSLGIVLYEMMTGCVPYEAETPMAVVVKHIIEPLPLPTTKNSDLPESIERVILKALAKNPDDRYQRATTFAQAFKDAVSNSITMPSEKPTVRGGAQLDAQGLTVVEGKIETQEEGIKKDIPEPSPLDQVALEATEVEPPPKIAEPSINVESPAQEISAPSPGVVSPPTKERLKGLFQQKPWLKWFIPAGGAATLICVVGLVVAFLVIPGLRGSGETPTEIPSPLTAEEHFMQGQNLFDSGDPQAAIIEYQAAMDQGIEGFEIYFSLADAFKEADRLDDALGMIDRVIQIGSEESWVHEKAGWFYKGIGDNYQAIAQFERALELNPDAVDFIEGLAESYQAVGEYQKAEEILAQSNKPGDHEDPQFHEEQGWEFLSKGQFPEAEEAFRKAIDLDPGLVSAWEGLADVYWYQNEYDLAIDTLNTASTVNEAYAPFYENLGWLYWEIGNLNQAEVAFNKARFLDTTLDGAWQGLAEVYLEKGELDLAIDVIETAIESNPESDSLYEKAGYLYWERGDLDQAIAKLEKAITIAPDTSYAYHTLSDIYYEMGNEGQALAELERALDVNPNRPDIHEAIGQLLLEWEQYEDAIVSFNQAIHLEPENGWTYLSLAFAYQSTDRRDAAVEALDNAERYSFNDPYLLEGIGWQFSEMGNCERALELFQRVLDIDPTNEGAPEGIASCSG
jgi:serine/threonine protein kinase/tetratricopeptide (TPR) repeat protein